MTTVSAPSGKAPLETSTAVAKRSAPATEVAPAASGGVSSGDAGAVVVTPVVTRVRRDDGEDRLLVWKLLVARHVLAPELEGVSTEVLHDDRGRVDDLRSAVEHVERVPSTPEPPAGSFGVSVIVAASS